MPSARSSVFRRLSWQLPLAIAALLLVVVALFSWAAYREVKHAVVSAAGDRLDHAARQLATLMAQSAQIRLVAMGRLAEDPAVQAAVASGANLDGARAILERFTDSTAQAYALELWSATGARVLEVHRRVGALPAVEAAYPSWAGDTVATSAFRGEGDTVWYEVAVPVTMTQGGRGYLVQRRWLASAPAATRLLTDLIGSDAAAIVLGVPGGNWTDLTGWTTAPPAGPVPAIREYQRGGRRLGAARPVPGTPWVLWIELPADALLARANAFLDRVLPVGLIIVLVGTGAGWAMSGRITRPLGRIRGAATAVAGGDLDQQVVPNGPGELRELADAFNTMAGQIRAAQHGLEEQVTARTAQLRATEEQFRAVTVTSPSAIITADGDGRITYFNPSAERVFGYRSAEVLGQPLTLLMPERFREAHLNGLTRFLTTGEAHVIGRTVELTGQRKGGSEFPLELSLASWTVGNRRAFAGILRDITTRKEKDDSLQRYAADLEAANRELEAFSYSVSHDLRAPLRAIHGFSHALLEDYRERLDSEGADHLRRVCAAADHMALLIDDMLELSQVSRAEMRVEPVDLSQLAHRIAADLAHGGPPRRVEWRIAEGLEATGDPRLLGLVLQNLLDNAWKFTARHDRATIEVGRQNGVDAAFYVRDNGAGFDMAYADKLFGVFQRLHAPSEFPGTGVGLAIVERIVHRHGGRVWAEAMPDRGATFFFTLSEADPRRKEA